LSKSQISPDEAGKLQEEIDHYLRWMRASESMLETEPTRFEKQLVEALSKRDAGFFRKLADLCEIGTNLWHWNQNDPQEVEHIAVQAKRWLEINHKTVNRPSIRSLTKSIWSALRTPFKPDCTFVGTGEVMLESPKGPVPVKIGIRRPPGIWSESDYITALQHELENNEASYAQQPAK
jgi:hypothetical protein